MTHTQKKSHVLQLKVPLATQRSPVPKLRPNRAKDRNIKKKNQKKNYCPFFDEGWGMVSAERTN